MQGLKGIIATDTVDVVDGAASLGNDLKPLQPISGERGPTVISNGELTDGVLTWLRTDPVFQDGAIALKPAFAETGVEAGVKMERGLISSNSEAKTVNNIPLQHDFHRMRMWVRAFKQKNVAALQDVLGKCKQEAGKEGGRHAGT